MPSRILIVDDSEFARRLLRTVLEAAGHDVVEADGGRQALAAIANGAVDLMIADIHMPEMDGLTLVRRLRADPLHRLVPVVLLTAVASPDRGGWPRDVEVDAWLTKPVDAVEARTTVRRLLRSR